VYSFDRKYYKKYRIIFATLIFGALIIYNLQKEIMKQLFPFPSIHQFRDIVYDVKLNATYTGKDEKDEPVLRVFA